MIRAYIRANQHQDSLKMYSLMAENERLEPDKYTFTFVLKACTGLSSFEKGVKIHEEVVKRNLENDVFIGTGLTAVYSKMGDLVSAWNVFDKMPERDVVVWNAMISRVAQCGEAVKAVELFKKMQIVCFPQEELALFRDMQNEYSQPNNVTLVSVIPACAELRAVRLGKSAHCHDIKASMDSDVSTGTALVSIVKMSDIGLRKNPGYSRVEVK
ncbi:hypothetical protein CQW23_09057 [Capsicum baccatum]|uniref:Pentatricopeptide repeat-containing protein n=1 Tax=Capsicum baccatum TaxID=33114 RepID=A0A2G2XAT8_CAPBA|nr:hypothetical protein CQW23_09057 [Capsicum baccatum]